MLARRPRRPGNGMRAVGGSLAGFGVAAASAARRDVYPLDVAGFRALNRLPDALHPMVWPVMQLGSLGAVPACALVAFRLGARETALRIAVAGGAAWVAAKPVKRLVRRGRPASHIEGVKVRGAPQSGLGFPAGHAAVSTAIAMSLGSEVDPKVRFGAAGVALAVAASRVYVGAHFPLDAVGGVLLGAATGFAARGLGRS